MTTYPHLCGTVISGEGIASTIGYPTANIDRATLTTPPPPDGIYAAWTTIEDETAQLPSIVVIGVPPQNTSGDPKVEIHLIDFTENLVSKTLTATIVKKIRDLIPYTTDEALIAQIEEDIAQTQNILRTLQATS